MYTFDSVLVIVYLHAPRLNSTLTYTAHAMHVGILLLSFLFFNLSVSLLCVSLVVCLSVSRLGCLEECGV